MTRRTVRARLLTGLGHVALGFSLAACSDFAQTIPTNPSNPIQKVAVVQLVNNTNDVDAPGYVRKYLAEEMGRHAYVVKPIPETDQLLKDQMGITLGKQFDMATPQQLGETLGVDGVLYGSLEDFSHSVMGVGNEKRVRVRAKLVNCKSGETVWSNGIGIVSGSGGQVGKAAGSLLDDSAKELPPLFGTPIQAPWVEHRSGGLSSMGGKAGLIAGAVGGIGEKVVTGAMNVPLYAETKEAVRGVLHSIPTGPGNVQPIVDAAAAAAPSSVPAPGVTVVTPPASGTGGASTASPTQATKPAATTAPVKKSAP
ncbi:MAG: DUF799 family lipoprotein [Nitrospiraceae bacterium]